MVYMSKVNISLNLIWSLVNVFESACCQQDAVRSNQLTISGKPLDSKQLQIDVGVLTSDNLELINCLLINESLEETPQPVGFFSHHI